MGVYDLGLPLDFFEHVTFAELCDLTERHSRKQNRETYLSAQIVAHIRWAIGDKEAQVEHFMPSDDQIQKYVDQVSGRAEQQRDAAQMEQAFIDSLAALGIKPDTE